MDPISAVSFAASIITFIDFGYKLVTGTLEVLKTGSLEGNTHINNVIDDFNAVIRPLARQPSGKSEHEAALKKLALECQNLSKKLLALLDTLQASSKGGNNSWKSMRAALRSMRKRGEVRELEEKLDKYRAEILTRLICLLNERQVAIQVQLCDFQSQVMKQSSDGLGQLQRLRDDVLEVVENTLRRVPPPTHQDSALDSAVQKRRDGDAGDQLQLLCDIREKLDGLLESRTRGSPEIRILKQLYFPSLHRREDDLAPADDHTFEWILDEGSAEHAGERQLDDNSSEERGLDHEKRAAASRLQHWLREENGVFHISGKAGSGKSTLMKLLLSNDRTKQELEKWAGAKQLVFAHFFFWLSGEQLQYSLEGLYRSILFEILTQCPELIPDVFPNAYALFSKASADNCIDELSFRPNDIKEAFTKLVTNPHRSGYRFCLFIDGLDEYGGEGVGELEHQQLADALSSWAAHRDIKILASSRPHLQFEHTFSDDRRIRLHELTRSDIVLAVQQMFERDKSFGRPEVQSCYADLVESVAHAAEGVFLWAILVTRGLLISIGRHDDIKFLRKRLDNTPKDLNKLYERMFESIDPGDQARAFKLLILVAGIPWYQGRLNVLALTWVEDLEDPEFPMKHCFNPYSDEEIQRRQLQARHQVDSLTRGLLEIVEDKESPLFFRHRVQFLHRTVRDFVLQSSAAHRFAAGGLDLTHISTYARLRLAELHFAKTDYIGGIPGYGSLHGIKLHLIDDELLDAFGQAIDHHNEKSGVMKTFCSMAEKHGYLSRIKPILGQPLSFLHCLALRGAVGYVRRKVVADPDLLRARGHLSLLLSATFGTHPAVMCKALLGVGASPHDLVWAELGTGPFTIWQCACFNLLYQLISVREFLVDDSRAQCCETIQCFLEAGADGNCLILLGRNNKNRIAGHSPTHAIFMRTLLQQLDPPNLGDLLKLMEEPKQSRGILGTFRSAWQALANVAAPAAATKPSFCLADNYIPCDLATIDELDLAVYSIVFGETRVDAETAFRIC